MSRPVGGRGPEKSGLPNWLPLNGSFQGPGASTVLVRCVQRGRTCPRTWPGPGPGPWPRPRLPRLAARGSWQVGAGPARGAQAGAEGAAWQTGAGGLRWAGARLERALGAVREGPCASVDASGGFVTLGPWAGAHSNQEFCNFPSGPRAGPPPDSPVSRQKGGTGLRGRPAPALPPPPPTPPGEGPSGRAPLPPRRAPGARAVRRVRLPRAQRHSPRSRGAGDAPRRGGRGDLRRRCAARFRGRPQPIGRAALRAAAAAGRCAGPGRGAAADPPAPQPGTAGAPARRRREPGLPGCRLGSAAAVVRAGLERRVQEQGRRAGWAAP